MKRMVRRDKGERDLPFAGRFYTLNPSLAGLHTAHSDDSGLEYVVHPTLM